MQTARPNEKQGSPSRIRADGAPLRTFQMPPATQRLLRTLRTRDAEHMAWHRTRPPLNRLGESVRFLMPDSGPECESQTFTNDEQTNGRCSISKDARVEGITTVAAAGGWRSRRDPHRPCLMSLASWCVMLPTRSWITTRPVLFSDSPGGPFSGPRPSGPSCSPRTLHIPLCSTDRGGLPLR